MNLQRASQAWPTMGFAGYVSVCVQLCCISVFHCLSLYISAYMAIFKCVGYFNFHMGFTGYVSVCLQLYCISVFHCLSLHVSAYMAIVKRVGFFIFICFKDSA
jgi:hypothetical protein